MDMSTIKRMSEEQYIEEFDNLLWDTCDLDEDLNFISNISKGHSATEHIGKTNIDMISRMVKESKDSVSSFTDKDAFTESMQDALIAKDQDIAIWIMKQKSEFDNLKDYNEFAFSLDLKSPEPIGYGFKKDDLAKYGTTGVRVVLRRDVSGESPLGFYIKTAYPDMSYAKPTGFECPMNEILNDHGHLTPMEKLYIDVKNDYPDALCKLQYVDGQEQLRVAFAIDDVQKIVAYFTENDYKFKLLDCDKKQNLRMDELYTTDRQTGKSLLVIESKKKAIYRGINEHRDIDRKRDPDFER